MWNSLARVPGGKCRPSFFPSLHSIRSPRQVQGQAWWPVGVLRDPEWGLGESLEILIFIWGPHHNPRAGKLGTAWLRGFTVASDSRVT